MNKIRLALLFILFTALGIQIGRKDYSVPKEMGTRTYYTQELKTHPRQEPKPHNAAITNAHKATHLLETGDITGGGHCSATAIGPHALLTASHCEAPSEDIGIDGDRYKLLAPPIRDKFDHSIFYVNATFIDWATISSEPVQVGDEIFLFGNPGKWDDIFRKGYVAAVPDNTRVPVVYDFNGWPGDSGSGIFNMQGQLVGVCSLGMLQQAKANSSWPVLRLMGGWTFQFTPEQIAAAVSYQPKPGELKPPLNEENIEDVIRRFFRHP